MCSCLIVHTAGLLSRNVYLQLPLQMSPHFAAKPTTAAPTYYTYTEGPMRRARLQGRPGRDWMFVAAADV